MKREDIVNKRFGRAFWGYDIRQVDEFLDEVTVALEGYEKGRELDLVRIKTLITELERRTGKTARPAEAPRPAAPAQPPRSGEPVQPK